MALTATIYNLGIDLADIDRGVYESLDLRVACQPSETIDYMLTRVLAYCLEYADGIAFTQGIAAGDEPAVWIRDMTGRIMLWVEVGLPDAERLHRANKLAERTVVYTHRAIDQLLRKLGNKKIYRAADIALYALDEHFIAAISAHIERRTAMTFSIREWR